MLPKEPRETAVVVQKAYDFLLWLLGKVEKFPRSFRFSVGDRVLRQFAQTLAQTIREANLAARWGGEEFVILLPDTDLRASRLVAERIRRAAEKMVVQTASEKPAERVTISLGVAVYPEHGLSLDELIGSADKALYESKRAGRNRVTVFEQAETPE